jgi:uncharacterized protein (DUF2267 family)
MWMAIYHAERPALFRAIDFRLRLQELSIMTATLPPKPRGLTLREARYLELKIANPDMLDAHALREAGFITSVCNNPTRVKTPEMAAYIESVRAQAIEATLQEAFFDAQEVLRELIRQLARLTSQAQRLHADLGHDLKDLYSETGVLRPVADWPEAFRTRLVVEMETREEFGRSQDGGDSSWDKTADIRKIKRESTIQIERTLLAVEKEIRECVSEIGRHVDVKAFPVPGDKLADAVGDLAGSIDRAISEGRQRAAQRNKLPINVTPTDK